MGVSFSGGNEGVEATVGCGVGVEATDVGVDVGRGVTDGEGLDDGVVEGNTVGVGVGDGEGSGGTTKLNSCIVSVQSAALSDAEV